MFVSVCLPGCLPLVPFVSLSPCVPLLCLCLCVSLAAEGNATTQSACVCLAVSVFIFSFCALSSRTLHGSNATAGERDPADQLHLALEKSHVFALVEVFLQLF